MLKRFLLILPDNDSYKIYVWQLFAKEESSDKVYIKSRNMQTHIMKKEISLISYKNLRVRGDRNVYLITY